MSTIKNTFKPIPRRHFYAPMDIRRLAGRLALRIDPADVAYLFSVDRETIYRWRARYA